MWPCKPAAGVGRNSTGKGTSTQMKSNLTAALIKLQTDSYLPG